MIVKSKRIGITGGIGSGKSEVAGLLRGKGYSVIDADELAREAAAPGEPAVIRLREEIGGGIFSCDGSLNRKKLGKAMFADPAVLKKVNEIFHGIILRRIEEETEKCSNRGEKAVFISVPLLFETGAERMMDEVWLVTADEDIRLGRVTQRDGMTEEDVRARMRSQMPEDEKLKLAGVVIENNGTKEELKAAVEGLLQRL